MGAKSDFKVVIGGGSITGLTMANMLQRYGIDFVVLEAYGEIAPQVGASIGLLPHGNRIMDQLGLFQKILDLCPPLDSFHFRDDTGKIIKEFRGMNNSMHERHGYPITFLDRQMVLKVLYDNIRDKSKILINKRVIGVEMTSNGVRVKCSDNSVHYGNILVGADGIHSTVRKEMWRLADDETPGWICPSERNAVPCDYGCVFGISNPCEGVEPGASNSVFRKHQSYIVNGGPNGRVYWFFFFKLAARAYGDDIPNFTSNDHDRILREREDDNITPTLKFKKVLDERVTSVLVPLQEYVFKQWYYKRIITIGDSAHKFHPIAGQGGNASIESAATLVNVLRELLAQGPKPSLDQIESAFEKTQTIRQARTDSLKTQSHEQQRTELLDTPLHHIQAFYLLPLADLEDVTFNFSKNMPLAERLNEPKKEHVHRLVPYKDELLGVPQPRGVCKWAFATFYILVAWLVYYGMWVHSAHWDLGQHLESVLENGRWSYDSNFRLKRSYIGIKFLDDYLTFLAAIFVPGLNEWTMNFGLLQMYFLGMLVQPIAVCSVEAYRKRHALTLVSLFTIWWTLVQFAGIGIFIPLLYAVYTFVSEPETYWWPLTREVPIEYASTLIFAVMVGYTLPTILMFVPWRNEWATQVFEALWQPSPMFVPIICTSLGFLYQKRYGSVTGQRIAKVPFADVPHLQRLYIISGALGVLHHVYCIGRILATPDVTLATVFWPDFSAEPKSFGEGLRQLFLVDFWGFYVASYAWLSMAVWDLRRVGRTTVPVGKAVAVIALGHLIIGPGATMSAVWYWREGIMAKTIFH